MYLVGFADNILKTVSVYKGFVTATGGGDVLPPSWTVSKTLPNKYEIFHNLGLVNLTDLIGSFTVYSPTAAVYSIIPVQALVNSIILQSFNSTNIAAACSFAFIAFKY